jgi:hypothetical protein
MAKGLLIASFDFSSAQTDEFHDWYDLEHVPEREAVSGFGACERWIGVDDPNQAVATYDLDMLDVLRSEAYRSIAYENLSPWSKRVTTKCTRILRFEGVQTLPGTMDAPAARRYKSPEGSHRYVAIYHLESPEVTRSDAWAKAVDTPWSARVGAHFQDRIRILAGKYVRGG